MGEPDRLARIWLGLISIFLIFQTPLMNHKLAMACGSALEALRGARQSRLEIQSIRDQLRSNEKDLKKDPLTIQTALETIPLLGPR